jgi:acetyltransferase-like isoleucine patch superfamily enzyme/antitoxin (DNA-binding transcriptional repressor) of toxin-antitoxin stability system
LHQHCVEHSGGDSHIAINGKHNAAPRHHARFDEGLQMTAPTIDIVGQGDVQIGHNVKIGAGAQIVFHQPGRLTIGDYCTIGPGVRFVCTGGNITLGDWTTLHDQCLVLSTVGVTIGQHGWFGQNSVLDGSGGLTIGNGVRIGMYSQLWSHVAAGEQIEGCTLFGTRPVAIEDDVWLVGSCIVASGVTIGRRTIALIGSNITKSWPAQSVIAGSPATAKPGLSFYRDVSLNEQWSMLSDWLAAIAEGQSLQLTRTDGAVRLSPIDERNVETIVFARSVECAEKALVNLPTATVCCVETKTYFKRLTGLEHAVLKALGSNKARFVQTTNFLADVRRRPA